MPELPVKDLVQFWQRADFKDLPYIHPEDDAHIYPPHRDEKTTGMDSYVASLRRDRLRENSYKLGLLPIPYLGDLQNASVFILMTNPGLSVLDFYAEGNYPAYRDEIINTLHQKTDRNLFLDTKWSWTGGFQWWENKFRGIADLIASERFDGCYGEALDFMSREIACMEWVPYHSRSVIGSKILPSSAKIRETAQALAADADRTFIVARSVKRWNLPEADNTYIASPGAARSASLNPNLSAGRKILDALTRRYS